MFSDIGDIFSYICNNLDNNNTNNEDVMKLKTVYL